MNTKKPGLKVKLILVVIVGLIIVVHMRRISFRTKTEVDRYSQMGLAK